MCPTAAEWVPEMDWIPVCAVDDIDPEDVQRFDYGAATYAIYRDPKGNFLRLRVYVATKMFTYAMA